MDKNINLTDGVLIPKKDDKIFTSWRICFYSTIIILVLLLTLKKDPYLKIFLAVIKGIPVTLSITTISIFGAVIIGILCGLGTKSNNKIISGIAGVYVEFIRGIPLLVQLTFIYYALGKFFNIGSYTAAVVSLSVCFGAYMGEIVRSGLQAVDKGQIEACKTLELSKAQTFIYVVLPQTIKIVIPAIGNEFISMVKDSSLVSAIALSDILRRGNEYISRTYLSLETLLVVAFIYLLLTLILSRIVGYIEEGLNK